MIYTDGGCIGNPGPGGWAAILVRDGRYEEIGGGAPHTTNNRMELQAAVEGLRRARPGERVHLVTDSRYLHDGISQWIHGWKRRGWRKADGAPVLNRDLWEVLDALAHRPDVPVSWEHVRGHAGHRWNERCDEIANGFARGAPPELRSGAVGEVAEPSESRGPARSYPVYLSLVDGQLREHPTWAACEARVKGVKGARHRKVRSPSEYRSALEAWGLAPEREGGG